jgi:hypothetical protein
MLTHQFREFGHWSVWTDPVDSFVHHVFDFHDGLPLDDTRAPSDLAQDTLKRVVGANPPHGCFEGWELTERGKRELERVQKPLMQSV